MINETGTMEPFTFSLTLSVAGSWSIKYLSIYNLDYIIKSIKDRFMGMNTGEVSIN